MNLPEGEDFYFEKGFMVFTAKHHLIRGYCCQNGCRHCPWNYKAKRDRKKENKNK